jgi:hypothetical protein
VFDEQMSLLQEGYAERGVPTPEWVEITPDVMAPSYHLYFRALKSPKGDPDGDKGLAERLIHDPVAALREQGVDIGDDPRVSTMVVNHERTLERHIVFAMVLVSTNPNTVGITLAKEEYKPEASPLAT